MKARKLPSGNYNVQYYYTDIEGNKTPHLHLKNGSVEPFFYVRVHYAFTMSRKYVRDFQKTPHQAVGGMS